jgi:hypothetical protein
MKRSSLLLAAVLSLTAGTAAAQSASVSSVPGSVLELSQGSLKLSDESLDVSSQISLGNIGRAKQARRAIIVALEDMSQVSGEGFENFSEDVKFYFEFLTDPSRVFNASKDAAFSLRDYVSEFSQDPSAKFEQSFDITKQGVTSTGESVSELATSTGQAINDTKTAGKVKRKTRDFALSAAGFSTQVTDVSNVVKAYIIDELLKPSSEATSNAGQATLDKLKEIKEKLIKLSEQGLDLSKASASQLSAAISALPKGTVAVAKAAKNSGKLSATATGDSVQAASQGKDLVQSSTNVSGVTGGLSQAVSGQVSQASAEYTEARKRHLARLKSRAVAVSSAQAMLDNAENDSQMVQLMTSPEFLALALEVSEIDAQLGFDVSPADAILELL